MSTIYKLNGTIVDEKDIPTNANKVDETTEYSKDNSHMIFN